MTSLCDKLSLIEFDEDYGHLLLIHIYYVDYRKVSNSKN